MSGAISQCEIYEPWSWSCVFMQGYRPVLKRLAFTVCGSAMPALQSLTYTIFQLAIAETQALPIHTTQSDEKSSPKVKKDRP